MKITCQTCQSKYTVSDEKVQGKTVKIKCRKCGATILVNSSGATTSAAGVADAVSISTTAGELGVSFLVNVAEGDQRTMSLVEVVDAYNASVVTADTYVWSDGMGDWQPLGQVESIVAALNSGAAPLATPEPAAPEPAAPYAAPYAAAAAAPQPAAEPAPRAAARRDSGRRGPDLFGGGMASEEVATSAPAFNGRAPSPMAASGGREENSMLFSLSALTAKAAPAAPASSTSSKSSASREDSGLIDLRALAESAGASGPTNLVPDHAGLFPLGAPQVAAPVAAPIMSVPSIAPPPASKAPIFIGIGIAVAGLAIVGAFFVMKGGDKPQPVAIENTAQTAASAAPPVVEPPPTATAVASAAPTPSASAAVASAKTTKGGTGKAGAGAAAPVKAGAGAGAAAAPAAPAAPAGPKKGTCGCAAGDLLCAMKCSAK
jgi:predicted Zn finger-like uncharacterized protein